MAHCCKTNKFHQLIFTDEGNPGKLNAAKKIPFTNDIEGDCQWLVKISLAKNFCIGQSVKIYLR